MKKNPTPLSKLYLILEKYHLFPNQDVFMNSLFYSDSLIEKKYYPEKEILHIRKFLNSDFELYLASSEDLTIYKKLIGSLRLEEMPSHMTFIIDPTSNKKTKNSKILNNIQKIPNEWRTQFGLQKNLLETVQNKFRKQFVEPLSLILQYIVLNYNSELVNKEKYQYEDALIDSFVSFYSIKQQIWFELIEDLYENGFLYEKNKEAYFNEISNSFYWLSYIIFKTILLQSDGAKSNDFVSPYISEKKYNFEEQKKEYDEIINIYGYKTIDRFHMLKKYSESNIYCACELGKIYYYGDIFSAERCKFEIEKDIKKAEDCYRLCINKPIENTNPAKRYAYWSLGLMILDGKSSYYENNYIIAKEFFNNCGNYAPALHSIGKIYYMKGEKMLNEKMSQGKHCGKYMRLDPNEDKEIIDSFYNYINYTYQAAKLDYILSYNSLYSFMEKDFFSSVRSTDKIYTLLDTTLKINPYELLKKSADRKNPWALDKLGNLYYNKHFSDIDRENQRYLAYKCYLEAFQQDYSWSAFHLIIYFLKEDDEMYNEAVNLIYKHKDEWPEVKDEYEEYLKETSNYKKL